MRYQGEDLGGKKCPCDLYMMLPFDSSETVLEVKQHISDRIGVPTDSMELYFAADRVGLCNNNTLFRSGVQSMSTLRIVFRNMEDTQEYDADESDEYNEEDDEDVSEEEEPEEKVVEKKNKKRKSVSSPTVENERATKKQDL